MTENAGQKTVQPSYRTVKRLKENYLITVGESLGNIVPTDVRPLSAMKRLDRKIKEVSKELDAVQGEEILLHMDTTRGGSRSVRQQRLQEVALNRAALQEQLQQLRKQRLAKCAL